MTSVRIFDLCLDRASNLIKIHEAAHGKSSKPEKYLSDAHRAAIVLAISALDAFIRAHVLLRIGELLGARTESLPEALSSKIKGFLKEDGLLDAARKDDLVSRVEKAFRSDFERRSFQGTRVIEEHLGLVGFQDAFHEIAIALRINEETLRRDLDEYTRRRHAIAHSGDYDLTQQPPKEQVITKRYAEDCIKLVRSIAHTINRIGSH